MTDHPPVEGYHYAAFAVHPPNPSDVVLGFAIAHCEGEQFVVDLVRENLRISECAEVMKRYGITEVTGGIDDESVPPVPHAICGVAHELDASPLTRKRVLQ